MSLLVNLRMSQSSHPSTPLVPLSPCTPPTHPPTHPVQMKMRTNEKSEELVNLRIRPSPPVSLVRSPPPEAPITGGRSRHSTLSLLLDVISVPLSIVLLSQEHLPQFELSALFCSPASRKPSSLVPIWVKFHMCALIRW